MEKRDPTPEGRLRTRALQRVFQTTELMELILGQVSDRTLVSVLRVNRRSRGLVVHHVPLRQVTSPARPGVFWTRFRREFQDAPDLSRLQLERVIEDLLRGRLHEGYPNQVWNDIVISASPPRGFESSYSDSIRCSKSRYDITVKVRGRAGLTMADVEDSVRHGLRGYRWHTLQKNMHTLKKDCFIYLFSVLVAEWFKSRVFTVLLALVSNSLIPCCHDRRKSSYSAALI